MGSIPGGGGAVSPVNEVVKGVLFGVSTVELIGVGGIDFSVGFTGDDRWRWWGIVSEDEGDDVVGVGRWMMDDEAV